MKLLKTFACTGIAGLLLVLSPGCQEPNYRNEVVARPQGGVDIHRVPKDPVEPTGPVGPTAQHDDETQAKIDALEAQVHKQQEEIANLKAKQATAPTTAP